MNSNKSVRDKQPTVSIEIPEALATSLSSGGEISDEQKSQLADAAKNVMSSKSADSSPPVSAHLKSPRERTPTLVILTLVAALLGFVSIATPTAELPNCIGIIASFACLIVLLTPVAEKIHESNLEMICIFLGVHGLTSVISAFVLQYAT